MLGAYVIVTGLVAAGIVYWRAGYLPAQLPLGLCFLVLEAMLLYSLTMVGSSLVPAAMKMASRPAMLETA